jgi:hypothetical protein
MVDGPSARLEGLTHLKAIESDHAIKSANTASKELAGKRRWRATRGEQSGGERNICMEPVPILTVGDLKSELSRWSDDAPVTFYSPLREQEFRFYRYRPGQTALVFEINEFPETPPLVLPGTNQT